MRFNCGPSKEERQREKGRQEALFFQKVQVWHDVFLWWPRRMEDGFCHWLETVECKWTKQYYEYDPPRWFIQWRLK